MVKLVGAETRESEEVNSESEEWQEVSEDLEKPVVEKMGYDDRNGLGQSTSNELKIVEGTPIFFDSIFFTEYDCFSRGPNFGNIHLMKKQYGNPEKPSEHLESEKWHVERFLRIFKCKESLVKEISFYMNETQPYATLIPLLISEAKHCGVKIRAKGIIIYKLPELSQPGWIADLLGLFDGSCLKSISLKEPTREVFDAVTATELWRNCKELHLDENISVSEPRVQSVIDIGQFVHGDKVSIVTRDFNLADVDELILRFILKERPAGSYFQYTGTEGFEPKFVLKYFGKYSWISWIKNWFKSKRYRKMEFIKKLENECSENLLFVHVKFGSITGRLCRRNYMDLDFMDLDEPSDGN